MKKLIYILILMIFLANTILAAEIDNGVVYEDNDMKAVIMNKYFAGVGDLLGIDEELGELTLASHSSPTEIKNIIYGNNRVTMYYDFDKWSEVYPNGLGEVIFTDKRTGLKIERNYYFAEAVYEDVEVPIYEEVCKISINKNNSKEYYICEDIESGTKTETRLKEWKKLENNDIPDHPARIGLVTDVFPNDYVDGVWTIAGKKISKHAEWQDSYSVGLFAYYNCSSNLESVQGTADFNLQPNADANFTSWGIRGTGCGMDGSGDYFLIAEDNQFRLSANSQQYTLNMWVRNRGGSPNFFFGKGTDYYAVLRGYFQAVDFNGTGDQNINTFPAPSVFMVTITSNTTSVCVGINSTIETCGSKAAMDFTTSDLHIGDVVGNYFTGDWDESGWWNRSLDWNTEIPALYDGGNCLSYDDKFIDVNAPEINITYPINNSFDSNTTLYIEYTRTDDGTIDSCWYSNGSYSINTTLPSCGNITGLTFPEGINNFKIWANDSTGKENSSQVIWTTIIPPEINIDYPANNSNFSINNVNVNYSVSDDSLDSCWWSNNNGISNNSIVCGQNITGQTWIEGQNNITIWANDSNDYQAADRISFNVDSKNPSINFTAPNQSITYFIAGNNLSVNWSVGDVHLDSCFYSMDNGVSNISVPCLDNNISINISTAGNKTFYLWANDTYGNMNESVNSWIYKIFQKNASFPESTIAGSTEDFYLYLTKDSSIQVSSINLSYNGTFYSTSFYLLESEISSSRSLSIPIDDFGNMSFYWSIMLDDGTKINTTSYNLSVQQIEIDNCVAQNNNLFDLNLLDEENQSAITGDIQVYMEIISPVNLETATSFNGSYLGISNLSFCSNILLNESDFLLNSQIKYDSENHSAEFYNIQRSNLSLYPLEYNLYDLKDEDTTKFKILYRGEKLIGVEGAIIQLQRKYISEGVYKIVEAPLTSADSSAIVHIDTDTNLYKAIVVKDGELLNIFDNLNFICQSELTGECTIDLFDYIVPPNSISIESLQDFAYAINSSIESKKITIDYSVPSGTTSTIKVFATQTDIIGEETICNTTVSSAGGSIDCEYDDTIQDSYIDYYVYKDDLSNPIIQKSYIVSDDLREEFKGDNYFILIVIALSLIFMAILSPEWIVVNAIISIIIGGATWLLRGMDFVLGLGSIAWLILAAVIIIIKISKQEDT